MHELRLSIVRSSSPASGLALIQMEEISDYAVHWLRFLLAEHYINGLPPLLAEQVEAALKSAGQWFPDPQLVYDPEPN